MGTADISDGHNCFSYRTLWRTQKIFTNRRKKVESTVQIDLMDIDTFCNIDKNIVGLDHQREVIMKRHFPYRLSCNAA